MTPTVRTRDERRRVLAAAALLGLVAAVGCRQETPAKPPDQASSSQASSSQVAAQVGGKVLTLEEVDKTALLADASDFPGLMLSQALYEARRRVVDQMVTDRLIELEAAARGTSPGELVEREVTAKSTPVQAAEVEAWYRENRARVGSASLEQVEGPIRQLLERERRQASLERFLAELKKKMPVRVLLDPPRREVGATENDPAVGPRTAAVQIIEFSDFQ